MNRFIITTFILAGIFAFIRCPVEESIPLSGEKELLLFVIPNKAGSVMTDAEGNVTVTIYESADVTKLVPVIRVSPNAAVSPASGTVVDFTDPVLYTITAQDGSSITFTVTVEIVLSGDKDLLSFAIPNKESSAMTDAEGNITVKVYELADITRLVPVVRVSPNASVSPAPGTTIDFTNPVQYTITAQDGSSKNVTVTVEIVLSGEKKLLSFVMPNNEGNVIISDEGNVTVRVYEFADITKLIPIVTVSPNAAVSPASGAVVDFTDPVLYTITAQDGSETTFTVTVSKDLSSHNEIVSLTLDGTQQIFEREGDYLYIYVPYETNVANIKANIVVSNRAAVSPVSGAFVNFTSPQIYTVTASDGTVKNYLVTVKRSPWRKVGNGPFSARDEHTVLVFNDKMWLFGGWTGDGNNHFSEVWNTADGINWQLVTNSPSWQNTEMKRIIVHNDKLWLIGGGLTAKEIWSSTDGIDWIKEVDEFPWSRRHSAYIASFKNKLWVIGGISFWDMNGNWDRDTGVGAYNDIWSSVDGVNWLNEKNYNTISPRGLIYGNAIIGENMYIYSGGIYTSQNLTTLYNDVWRTSDGVNWIRIQDRTAWSPRAFSSICVFRNELFIVGGSTRRGGDLVNEVYTSKDGINWNQQKHSFFSPRHAAALCVFNDKLWLIGGFFNDEIWILE